MNKQVVKKIFGEILTWQYQKISNTWHYNILFCSIQWIQGKCKLFKNPERKKHIQCS